MGEQEIRVILDSSGKTVIFPMIHDKKPCLIGFLRKQYLKDLDLKTSELHNLLMDCNNIILAEKRGVKN